MNHWELFKQSWSIFWRHKALWVFGLLVALGGGFNFSFSFADVRSVTSLTPGARELLSDLFAGIDLTPLIIGGLIIGAISLVLGTFGEAALISMVDDLAGGRSVSVATGARAARLRFWPLLLTRLLLVLPVFIIGVLAAGSFLSAFSGLLRGGSRDERSILGGLGVLSALGVIGFAVGLLSWAVSISAQRAVVLDQMSPGQALVRGWKWLWAKFADYLVVAVIFLALGIAAGAVLACVLAPIVCGVLLSSLPSLSQLRPGVQVFETVFTIAGWTALILILVGLIVGSLVSVFVSGVWTLAYREWRVSLSPAPPAPVTT